MSLSAQTPENDKNSVIEPPSAFVRGRKISLEAYGVAKVPTIVGGPAPAVLDDFGLPLRRRPSSGPRRSTTGDSDKEGHVGIESEADGGRPIFLRRRSRSTRSNERSQSLGGQESENGVRKENSEQDKESERSRIASFRQRSRSVQGNGRSRSLSQAERASSTPRTQTSQDSRPDRIEEAARPSTPLSYSQHDTLDRILEGSPVVAGGGISEWSHQALAAPKVQAAPRKEDEWQAMPAYGKYDVYDDEGKLLARGTADSDDEDVYDGLGGAGKGYTRVQIDDDAKSATSMDENTSYLFKEKGTNVVDEDEEQRDPMAQMEATKDLLTEGQRIAYVGVTRLAMAQMVETLENTKGVKFNKKELNLAVESMKMWSQKMMVRLYAHMEINSSEQIMIEQLADHGVQPSDLTPALMKNSRVRNPMAVESSVPSPNPIGDEGRPSESPSVPAGRRASDSTSPPPYELHQNEELPEVQSPGMMPTTRNIDIDLRWTVLCDLFLVLIADSVYDSRSRVLLETVGTAMEVPWIDICRFEKRVTDALEMQEAASRENWDEAEHMETRRKMALRRKYMMMGLATVGGTLVIGLSAGLLAPVIGAGLAAGFTTIGVAGTSGFLAGAGGTALITTGAALSGGTIAVRASHRRTGAVKTFEYRPLHNNKRVNLIVTIAGWMNGKIDDVRLPFSTIDPIMGDVYSLLWEPEMLQSMGDTIRILATEALTQGLQQVLASTILTALMASLTLPIVLTKLSYLIDNPWTVSLDRADAAGLILADSLIDRNLGARPITLVGFSLGSRLIFSCLKELASKGAHGLIQNVYLFGSPVVAKKEEYLRARTVISGRFVNGYASNDWILGYLFRATSGGISRVAGLAAVEDVPGLENRDFTKMVNGHMAYRAAMPRLLREVGWEVVSDEFAEIEDPDPENHEARQRELIKEIEDAREEAQAQPGKRRWGIFKQGKLAKKKGWETYDDNAKEGGLSSEQADERKGSVLFDIDAIRAELHSEQLEIRQLESTLPPMKLDLNGPKAMTEKMPQEPFSNLRATKSFDESTLPVNHSIDSQLRLPNGHISVRGEEDNDEDEETVESEKKATTSSNNNPPASAVLAWSGEAPHANGNLMPHRPEFKSAATMPAAPMSVSGNPLHNAWADEEDDFGHEREVKLSFE